MPDPLLPELDDRRCTGCGDCVRVCPTDCLELLGRVVWLPRPADCIGCAACAAVCPTDALTLPSVTPVTTRS